MSLAETILAYLYRLRKPVESLLNWPGTPICGIFPLSTNVSSRCSLRGEHCWSGRLIGVTWEVCNIKGAVAERAGKIPAERLRAGRMPGHWLLARLGKGVLPPGGIDLTREMLDGLGISPADQVVGFARGLGSTARLALERGTTRI